MPNLCKPTGIKEARLTTVETLAKRFIIEPNGCWQWRGYIGVNGYAHFTINRKSKLAHRILWELVGNTQKPELQLDHTCENKSCVNPKHLDEVTPFVNTARGDNIATNNRMKTRCVQGHPFSGENLSRKRRPHGYERVCLACHRDTTNKFRGKSLTESVK